MSPAWARWGRRLVAFSLLAFPRHFRRRHGADALAYWEDRAAAAARRGGALAALRLTVRDAGSAVASGLRERLRHALGGGPGPDAGPRPRLGPDVLAGLRSLRRNPRFVLAAALPIGLGVAAVSAVFAVVDAVLLRPLPHPDPDALVVVGRPLASGVLADVSTANAIDLEGTVPGFDAFGAVQGGSVLVLDAEGAAEMVPVTRPTRGFMEVLDVPVALGRGFTHDDFHGAHVALITAGLWHRRFGGDPGVLGASLQTDRMTLRIVGVLADSWTPPEAVSQASGELWFPLDYDDPIVERTRAYGFTGALGRLRAGASLDEVNEQLRARALALAEEHPRPNTLQDGSPRMLEARSLHAETVGDFGGRLAMILGAVGALLLIACANVANLFLARSAARTREMALRSALGAGRLRLVVQGITEALGVALVGGTAGLVLAWLSVDALVALTPDLPRADAVAVDARVAAFCVVAALASGLLFGVLPAWTGSGVEPGRTLQTHSPRHSRHAVRGGLVVGQVALAVVLLAGGGLLLNSVVRLSLVDLGFTTEGVYTLQPRLPADTDRPEASAYVRTLVEHLDAVPGVSHVAGSLFMAGEGLPIRLTLEHPITGDSVARWRHSVLPGYFSTLDVRLVEGRDLDPRAGPDDPPELVVSQSLARELWPDGTSVLGRTVRGSVGTGEVTWTIVGVVPDVRSAGPHEAAQPLAYHSWYQDPWLPSMSLAFRYAGPEQDLAPAVREAARRADPGVPIVDVGSLADQVGRNTIEQRHYALLLGLFSLVALGIASVGVYATMSYTVAGRLREMGIRRAIGARRGDVVAAVLGQGLGQTAVGVALGTGLAWWATRVLEDLLFEVEPADPATFGAVAAVLLAVGVTACALPAARAARSDPVAVLRNE